ncbi:MAG: hypothetical protein M5U08_13345 [Burkholderiales bacterium]|nr:hypothetical protein [Burkholderiales bacterium]
MLTLMKDEAVNLAEKTGWTFDFAAGFLAGESAQARRRVPAPELLGGTDDYALGVQIGFHYGEAYLAW